MIIFSQDRNSSLEIEFIEAELERLPSIKVNIKIQNEGFTGARNVWIDLDKLNSFLLCMDEMDVARSGKASLCSMSPNDFVIEFETYDKSGHIKVVYSLMKYTGSFLIEIALRGAFYIDSSEFSDIVKSFKTLQANN